MRRLQFFAKMRGSGVSCEIISMGARSQLGGLWRILRDGL